MIAIVIAVVQWTLLGAGVLLLVRGIRLQRAGRRSLPTLLWSVALGVCTAVLGVPAMISVFGPHRPAPTPSPSCAQIVDLPDADPPRHGVCVSPEEAA